MTRRNREKPKGYFSKAVAILRHKTAGIEGLKDVEFLLIIKDLADDPAVKGMADTTHHDDSTLAHALAVSQAAYYLAKAFKLDAISSARGALLHDFFLYDWRDGSHRYHRTRHPRTALENARARFHLNRIEEDIILTHMWPVARPFYSYRESFLVSSVDKIVSLAEIYRMLRSGSPVF